MTYEQKEQVLNLAKNLIFALEFWVDDEIFLDDVLNAINSADSYALDIMLEELERNG